MMTRRTLSRCAAAATVSAVAGLAFATPATAMVDPAPPPAGGNSLPASSSLSTSDDNPWPEIAAGVVGGLALAGIGVAAGVGVRRRSVAHTA